MAAGSKSEGEAPGGDRSSGYEIGDKGGDVPRKLFEGGGELHKATGHGVGDDCERTWFYDINGGGE